MLLCGSDIVVLLIIAGGRPPASLPAAVSWRNPRSEPC